MEYSARLYSNWRKLLQCPTLFIQVKLIDKYAVPGSKIGSAGQIKPVGAKRREGKGGKYYKCGQIGPRCRIFRSFLRNCLRHLLAVSRNITYFPFC